MPPNTPYNPPKQEDELLDTLAHIPLTTLQQQSTTTLSPQTPQSMLRPDTEKDLDRTASTPLFEEDNPWSPKALGEAALGDIKKFIAGNLALGSSIIKTGVETVYDPDTGEFLPTSGRLGEVPGRIANVFTQKIPEAGMALASGLKSEFQEYLEDPAGKFARDPLFVLMDISAILGLGASGGAALAARAGRVTETEYLLKLANGLEHFNNPLKVADTLAINPLRQRFPAIDHAFNKNFLLKTFSKLASGANKEFLIQRAEGIGQVNKLLSGLPEDDWNLFYDLAEKTTLSQSKYAEMLTAAEDYAKTNPEAAKLLNANRQFLKVLPDDFNLANHPEVEQALAGWKSLSEDEQAVLMALQIRDPSELKAVIYQPLNSITGLPVENIEQILGTDSPMYLPHIFNRKLSFADFFLQQPIRSFSPTFLRARSSGLGRFIPPEDVRVGVFENDPRKLLIQHRVQFLKFQHNQALVEQIGKTFGVQLTTMEDIDKAFTNGIAKQEGQWVIPDTPQVGEGRNAYPVKLWYPDGYVRFVKTVIDSKVGLENALASKDMEIMEATAEAVRKSIIDYPHLKEAFNANMEEIDEMVNNAKAVTHQAKMGQFQEVSPGVLVKQPQQDITRLIPIPPNAKIFAVPQPIMDKLGDYIKPRRTDLWGQSGLVYDNITQLFRASWLSLSPRWVLNNTIGNVILNTMAGVNPISYIRALMPEYNDIIPKVVQPGLFQSELYMPEMGRLESTTTGKLIDLARSQIWFKTLGSIVNPISKAIGDTNQAIEAYFRRALYIDSATKLDKELFMRNAAQGLYTTNELADRLKQLQTLPALQRVAQLQVSDLYHPFVDEVNKWLFDYYALSPMERRTFRRIVPFYSWLKNINRLVYSLPFEHPVRADLVGILSRVTGDITDQDELPPQIRGTVALDNFYRIRGGGPGILAQSLVPPSLSEAPTQIGLHPLINFLVENMTGVDPFSQRIIRNPDQTVDPISGRVFQWSPQKQDLVPVDRIKPKFTDELAKQLPQYAAGQGLFEWFKERILDDKPQPIKTNIGYVFPPSPFLKSLQLLGIPISPGPLGDWRQREYEAITRARKIFLQQKAKDMIEQQRNDELVDNLMGRIR